MNRFRKYLFLIAFFTILLNSCSLREKARPTLHELASLASHVYDPNDNNKLPHHLVCDDYTNESLGFTAATYSNQHFKIVVFRGTKNVFDGIADVGLALSGIFGDKKPDSDVLEIATGLTTGVLDMKVKQAQQYYTKSKENESRTIIIVGHSLGGFFAQVVGYTSGEETHTFNAPGAAKYIEKKKLKQAADINITNHLSMDVVSNFGKHVGRDTTYNNSGHSIDDFCKFLQEN